jgi:cyclopropane fatty-acyl-phospholipid synthase-like methyltransferase
MRVMEKPYSMACDRNRDPILKVMKEVISADDRKLLEIGSGTGQHAVYLAPHFPHIIWVTSDVKANHKGIQMWLDESGAPNIIGPGEFEVGKNDFPMGNFDIVFSANTFHIMHWKECKTLMKLMGRNLREGTQVLVYGPFNYNGKFTSASNEEFDKTLKAKDPQMGIRNFEDVITNMKKNGFLLSKDYEMPANNRLLVFMKIELVQ